MIKSGELAMKTYILTKLNKIKRRFFKPKQLDPIPEGKVLALEAEKIMKGNVTIGDWTYVSVGSKVYSWTPNDKVTIGKFCSIADDVKILPGGNHQLVDRVSTYPFKAKMLEQGLLDDIATKGNVTIGNDVWIGTNVVILSGVNIGNGAIVGAGAVISKDVPDYAIVVGNPGKIVKFRFSNDTIDKLLNLKWWEWPDEKIKTALPDFYNDVDKFLEKYYGANIN